MISSYFLKLKKSLWKKYKKLVKKIINKKYPK